MCALSAVTAVIMGGQKCNFFLNHVFCLQGIEQILKVILVLQTIVSPHLEHESINVRLIVFCIL